jgi:ABC-type proline/glycine betaine transport system permease subunit
LGIDQWNNAMDSLALVIVAALLAILVSIPLGIWAARNSVVSKILKPIMDFLQTMPALVYLLPAIALFRIGVAPGIFATVLFALAPGVRLTELGIRGVDKEVVEAGQAFGASPSRILRQIQLPLAMPSIMAGINQIIMLSLSMVVIAGFVGAGGLGGQVVKAMSALDMPLGFESGMAVVILAIILDRFTGAFGNKRAKSLAGLWVSWMPARGGRPGDATEGKEADQVVGENRVTSATR